jgi:hypothetical protein
VWVGGMRAGVGEEVSKNKNTSVSSRSALEIFSEPRILFVDDDSGLSAIWSVPYRTEFL